MQDKLVKLLDQALGAGEVTQPFDEFGALLLHFERLLESHDHGQELRGDLQALQEDGHDTSEE